MNLKSKNIFYFLLLLPVLYIAQLLIIDIDVNKKRPILNIFKLIQDDSALEIVDFSVDKKTANINDSAVKACSPPDNKVID